MSGPTGGLYARRHGVQNIQATRVQAQSSVSDSLTVNNNATIGGQLTLTGGLTNLTVINNATVGGSLSVASGATVESLAVTNGATVDGSLAVNGQLTLRGPTRMNNPNIAALRDAWVSINGVCGFFV